MRRMGSTRRGGTGLLSKNNGCSSANDTRFLGTQKGATFAVSSKIRRLTCLNVYDYPTGIMKNTRNTHGRFFHKWVRRLFAGLIKRKTRDYQKVLNKLRDIEDSIEIIAHEMTRWAKRGE
jgi:hypothetical protein